MDSPEAITTNPFSSDSRPQAETIILRKISKYWSQREVFARPDGTLILTTSRLVFLAGVRVPSKIELLSFPLAEIKNVRARRVWVVSPAIEFETGGENFIFTFFAGARRMVNAIEIARRRLEGFR